MRLLRIERLQDRCLLAADVQLVKDFNTTSASIALDDAVVVGTETFFLTRSNGHAELWKIKPNQSTPTLVSELPAEAATAQLTNVNGLLYFVAGGPNGYELWKSDGTTGGTQLVKDIAPGPTGSSPYSLTNVGGTLYFTAGRSTWGRELWKSDGDAARTVLVRDLAPGTQSSYPSNLVAVGNTLYFTAVTSTHGRELFRSQGTASTTNLVRDILPGFLGSNPEQLVNVAGSLYFSATGPRGPVLWRSEGTPATTNIVREFGPFGAPDKLTEMNGELYFTLRGVNAELWKSGGTAATTVQVKDIALGSTSSYPASLVNAGGILYFTAFTPASGRELWRSNGTAAGTVQLRDINPGTNPSNPSQLLAVGKAVFFAADDGVHGIELWRTNGSSAGTQLAKDLRPGIIDGLGFNKIYPIGNKVLFAGLRNDNSLATNTLWTSGGSDATTLPLEPFATRNNSAVSDTLSAVETNGTLYVMADDGGPGIFASNPKLWKSDGTTSGTVRALSIFSSNDEANIRNLVSFNGMAFFTLPSGFIGNDLWRTDGTPQGTIKLSSLNRSFSGSINPVPDPVVLGDALYFTLSAFNGMELWKTDGTLAGTMKVKLLGGDTVGNTLFKVGTAIYFTAGSRGNEALWKSDGTEAGTVRLRSIGALGEMAAVGADVFFAAFDQNFGYELWKTQGTEATTVLVKDIMPGASSSNPVALRELDNRLVFAADDGVHGIELWESDGTPEGTSLWHELVPGATGSNPKELTVVNDQLYFSALYPGKGRELIAVGSVGSPRVVLDIASGSESSDPTQLTMFGGVLYFGAYTTLLGRELWQVENGTASLVSDIHPGAAGSDPILKVTSNHLYIFARTADLGREFYRL